jgi:hypothetical protein
MENAEAALLVIPHPYHRATTDAPAVGRETGSPDQRK